MLLFGGRSLPIHRIVGDVCFAGVCVDGADECVFADVG